MIVDTPVMNQEYIRLSKEIAYHEGELSILNGLRNEIISERAQRDYDIYEDACNSELDISYASGATKADIRQWAKLTLDQENGLVYSTRILR